MRSDEQLRTAILGAVPFLPPVFDAEEVGNAIGENLRYLTSVRRVLAVLASEGCIFEAYMLPSGERGCRPARWSADPHLDKREAVTQSVESAIRGLPRYFRVNDILARLRVSRRFAREVVGSLDRLAALGHVIKISRRLIGRPGMTNHLWSADPEIIAEEKRLQNAIEIQRKRELDERQALFERLSRPLGATL